MRAYRKQPQVLLPSPEPKVKDHSLDAVRSVAVVLVVTIHVAAPGFSMLAPHWWAFNFYDSIARIAVPLFFMTTGALLLHREHSVRSIGRRVVRITIPLLVWSAIYSQWVVGAGAGNWPLTILKSPVVYHLWYLYTLAGVYLFLPLFSGFYRTSTPSTRALVLTGWFVGACVLPHVASLTGTYWIGIDFSFMPLYAGYVVLGAVSYRDVPINARSALFAFVVWVSCSGLTAYLTCDWTHATGKPSEMFYENYAPLVVIAAVAAFITIRYVSSWSRLQAKPVRQAMSFVARMSFGVYLAHVLVIHSLQNSDMEFSFGNPWLEVPLNVLGVLCICLLFTAIVQRIPYLRAAVPG